MTQPRDPKCTCQWSPVRGRIWCQNCRTSGPLTGSRAVLDQHGQTPA